MPGRRRRAGCRGLRVRRLSSNRIPPGRLGTTGRVGILSPTRTAGARLRARRWRGLRRSLRGWCVGLGPRCTAECPFDRCSPMRRATYERHAIYCGPSIRRCARLGSRGSASMICGIPLPRGSFKPASMSTRSRNWADGKRSQWCSAMHTISRKVCAGAPRCWIDCGEKIAQN